MPKHRVSKPELSRSEHFVQIYESESVFLESLDSFVTAGLVAGDCVIAIATQPHRNALEARLSERGIDLTTVRSQDRYIPLDAEETLARFLVGESPDPGLFSDVVMELLHRGKGRRVRLFGEGVALLWAQGNHDASIQLEYLWNRVCETEPLSVFCAYPRTGFTLDDFASVKRICELHSKVIDRLIAT